MNSSRRYVAEQCAVILDNWAQLASREEPHRCIPRGWPSVACARPCARSAASTTPTHGEEFAARAALVGARARRTCAICRCSASASTRRMTRRTPRAVPKLFLAAQIARGTRLGVAGGDRCDEQRACRAAARRDRADGTVDPPFTEHAALPAGRARKRVKKADAKVRRAPRARAGSGGGGRSGGPGAAPLRAQGGETPPLRPRAGRARAGRGRRRRDRAAGAQLQDAFGEHQDAVVAAEFLGRLDVARRAARGRVRPRGADGGHAATGRRRARTARRGAGVSGAASARGPSVCAAACTRAISSARCSATRTGAVPPTPVRLATEPSIVSTSRTSGDSSARRTRACRR